MALPTRPGGAGTVVMMARAPGVLRGTTSPMLAGASNRPSVARPLAALDEHQVRSWTCWYRWTILALLASAFLSVLA